MNNSDRSGTVFIVVRSDGSISNQTGAARDLEWSPELEEAVQEAATADAGTRQPVVVPGLGRVLITTLHGEGSGEFLLAIDRVEGNGLAELTVRQREVAWLAVSDLSVDEIAWELEISSNTVKYHLKEIYRRLDVSSRLELAAKINGSSLRGVLD